jgi:hypothetical protein
VKFVGIGAGLSVKGVEAGFVLWSVCRFIRRSALLGTVHKMGLGMVNWRWGLFGEGTLFLHLRKNRSITNVRYYDFIPSVLLASASTFTTSLSLTK